eukprot:1970449-Prymnesium_polylepis.1
MYDATTALAFVAFEPPPPSPPASRRRSASAPYATRSGWWLRGSGASTPSTIAFAPDRCRYDADRCATAGGSASSLRAAVWMGASPQRWA